MVLYSHQYPLLGHESPYLITLADNWGLSLGSLGVTVFFAISGYLVTQSWIRDPHIGRYIAKRFLRVWPGLAAVTLLAVFIVGPLVSTLSLHDYFQDSRTWNYLRALYLKIIFPLPGVFEDNSFPNAVNGSLWTVRIEFRWYLYLLVLGMATSIAKPEWRRWIFLVFIFILALYYFVSHHAQTRAERSWSLDYGMYFCLGALMYVWHKKWRNRYWMITMASGCIAYLLGQPVMAALLVIVPTVIAFGNTATPVIKDAGRFGDFSYGLYIYAFMLQQTLAWHFGDALSFAMHLILATIASFVCAALSWHLVEKPALSLKRRLSRQ